MADVLDPASMLEAAEKAAGDGDYPAAERLLREVADLQEARLGAEHPDLATTLNNLAFVCERTNKFDEAERGYRRAHAIAVASLSPGHPFIATSLKNLLDFCAARDIPVWVPPAAKTESAPVPAAPAAAATPATERRAAPVSAARTATPWRIALSVAGVVVVAAVTVGLLRGGGDVSPSASVAVSSPAEPTTPAPSPTAEPSPEPSAPAPRPAPAVPVAIEKRPDVTAAPVSVLTAQLCSALERRGSPDWQCTPVSGESGPGSFLFYTRLLTNVNTTVEHRWYRDDRLHQAMRLRIIASPGSGYRTFSGNTVTAERTGRWKVELRGPDGTVLREEQFVVR